ncbi:hypothetical protein MKX01_009088 [Papaver californicum]|nr:hypothetical protein MKX01_009088 [Papaver californicum]
MGVQEKIKMVARRSMLLNFLLCFMVVMCFLSHTAAMNCKSGETFASTGTLVCLTCNPQCKSACPKGSTVTKTNCVPIRFLDTPLCECCCKMPPPSPPPPSPSPPPPSPPPPSPSPPPPPSPSPPPAPSCPEVCPSEFEFQMSPDQPPCTYKLASQIMIM